MSTKFRIIGSGEWGLAIGNHLSRNSYPVEIYGRTKNKVERLIREREYLNLNLKFNDNVIFKHLDDIHDKNDKSSKIYNFIATSSSGFADCVRNYKDYLDQQDNICWLTKGIDEGSSRLLDEVVYDTLGNNFNFAILSGPSFAKDLALQKNMCVSLATSGKSITDDLVNCFETEFFHIEQTSDLIGVQISGIMKNVAAILAGILSSTDHTHRDILKLIDLTKDEILQMTIQIYSNRKLDIDKSMLNKTLMSPACDGDLRLSCLEDHSRNRRFGLNWYSRQDTNSLLNEIGTVEGYNSAIALSKRIRSTNFGPVLSSVYNILFNNSKLEDSEVIKYL